ncbi:MAG: molecular chaperone TorD family protein [Halarsenatibacteraceae bacterium]
MLENSIREKTYLTFASLLSQPDQEIYEDIKAGLHNKILRDYFSQKSYDIHMSVFEEVNSLEEMKRLWRANICPEEGQLKAVESIYKVWTLDDSYDLPFANDKGYLMGDWALHIKHLFKEFELEIPEDYQAMPDYICFELEFMSLLIAEDLEEEQKLFLLQHLDWIPDLREEAEEKEISENYLQVIKALEKFIRLEWQEFALDNEEKDKFQKFER